MISFNFLNKKGKMGITSADLKIDNRILFIISCFYDLPLLPAEKMREGFSVILKLQKSLKVFGRFSKFNNYYRNY